MLARQPAMLWLGCGNMEGSTTEWTIFLVTEQTLLQRVQSCSKTVCVEAQPQLIWQHIQTMVETVPRIANIVWE